MWRSGRCARTVRKAPPTPCGPLEDTTARLGLPQPGRRRCSYPESEDCSAVFLTLATGCLNWFPVGLVRAPASIPTQRGRVAWFTAPSASGRTGSRTGLPHCTPLRHCGVDRARDWPRQPRSEGSPWDQRAPEPFVASALSPKLPPEPVRGRGPRGSRSLPLPTTWGQYRDTKTRCKRRSCFGLALFVLATVWTSTVALPTAYPVFPHGVDMLMGIQC